MQSNKALDKSVGRSFAQTANVSVRRDGKLILVDIRGVPLDRAAAAFGALSAALK